MASLRFFNTLYAHATSCTQIQPAEKSVLTFLKELKTPDARLKHYVAIFADETNIIKHRDFFDKYAPAFQSGSFLNLAASYVGADKAHEKQCKEAVKVIDDLIAEIEKDGHVDWRPERVFLALIKLKEIHTSIHPRWRSPAGVAGVLEKILKDYRLPIEDEDFKKAEELLYPLFTRERERLRNAIEAYKKQKAEEEKVFWYPAHAGAAESK